MAPTVVTLADQQSAFENRTLLSLEEVSDFDAGIVEFFEAVQITGSGEFSGSSDSDSCSAATRPTAVPRPSRPLQP